MSCAPPGSAIKCEIKLSADKDQVLREAFRAPKPAAV
jgi:hypothetical protein